jgi:hypothetical protein
MKKAKSAAAAEGASEIPHIMALPARKSGRLTTGEAPSRVFVNTKVE